ncbi:MAG TPA: pyridoxal-phosphate dependent enzyme, partial [Gemmatimonadaceae bacterium]
ALAWGARTAGVKCTVVMPATASQTKVAATRGYGAEVILHGTGTEALAKAHEMSEQQGLTLVHPFDDDRIIAGTGTIALEILDEWKGAPDVVVVPIGGGGLISGIALAIKELAPATRVIGVEPTGADVMRQSLDAGHPTSMKSTNTIADGLAAPMAGVRNFEIVKRYVDDVVLVSDDEIAEAMRMLLLRGKLLAEPAGAAAAAALVTRRFPVKSSDSVVVLVSGGNVDTERIKSLI